MLPSKERERSAVLHGKRNDTDAEYYRRAADVLRKLKWASIIAVFAMVIVTFFLYRHELTLENFRYILRYADFDMGTDYKASNQISYKTYSDTDYAYLKGDLAMLNSDGFSVYEFTGQALVDDRLSYLNPVLRTGGRYALVYDATGSELALYNSNGCLFEKDFPYGIKDATVRSDGIFAVVSSEEFVMSKATVYAADYNADYEFKTTDKEIIGCSLPDGTSRLDLIMFNAVEGEFLTYIRSYDLKSRKESHSTEARLYGEYPLKIASCKDSITVLTDTAIHFYDKDLNEKAAYSHRGGILKSFFESDGFCAVTFKKDANGKAPVRLYSNDGREYAFEDNKGEIISFSKSGKDIYLLEKGKLHIRSVGDEGEIYKKSISEVEVDESYCEVFAKSGSEYILASSLGAGKFE